MSFPFIFRTPIPPLLASDRKEIVFIRFGCDNSQTIFLYSLSRVVNRQRAHERKYKPCRRSISDGHKKNENLDDGKLRPQKLKRKEGFRELFFR
mmetsp:Transcript_6426/g.6632  ORF Transcript_6426/g.6632 Transcript_6426/m.6632 type:complete len:94 (-) Transcript_6426:320-601(-)